MKKFWLPAPLALLLGAASSQAGLFDGGIGGAMYSGPYTGGHAYSQNTAYGYGFAFSPADTWQRDLLAYPGGIYPYRPYGQPIYYRVFPKPDAPYVSVPGPDGLPILVPTAPPAAVAVPPGLQPAPLAGAAAGVVSPASAPALQPVPASEAVARPATIHIRVPANAEVWFDKEKTTQTGENRVFASPPLATGKMLIYSVRARWNEGGREVEQYRVVGVRAGESARLTFPAPRP